MALMLPRGAVREYLAIYGVVAIYVAALPAGAFVSCSRDLLHSLLALRRRWLALQITCAYWVKDKTDARLICREVNASLSRGDDGLLVATARTAQRKVENVAAHMGIALTEHDTVLARARTAVAYIEQRIAQAQAAGELAWFNSAYRAWRLEAKQQGRGMSYAEARARLRQNIFRQILTNEVQTGPHHIFPPLPGIDFPVPE
ncbi:hypothetical protein HAP48_0028205 [Bradyrhizobium septentrionale]|uniref:Uncharacterized protein n=1 Tax=Bradyrhizobium septentrionale TaxID=1404411 RepID=A0A973VXG1_9BRAD|nr:hypothetical protein [Bradyrhizobium septentrionale]UGY12504.1 hypothetical protein HAP48_0028205 [Bradyrhizobium septentrionale]